MQEIMSIIDELVDKGVNKDRAVQIASRLLEAGRQSAYAALGEVTGRHTISQETLSLLIAGLIAIEKESDERARTG